MRRRTALTAAVAAPWILRSGSASASAPAKIGLPLPITGVQAPVAAELLAGYQLAFGAARRQGLEVDLVVEDDRADVKATASAVQKFGRDPSIVVVTGLVGTPHAKAAIPEARSAQVPVIGIRSGAKDLRDGGPFVYHLRASYEAEISRMVAILSNTIDRISVVYSDDAFGQGAVAHLRVAAQAKGVHISAAVAAQRNGGDVEAAVKKAVDPSVRAKALVILMITRPAINALRTARAEKFLGPTMAMSFTATAELNSVGPNVLRGLGLVSAFPVPRAAHDETTIAFRAAAERADNGARIIESVTAYEGFVYGTAITRAMRKCEGRITREALMRAMTSAPNVRVGGEPLQFDQTMTARQYLEALYFDFHGLLRA